MTIFKTLLPVLERCLNTASVDEADQAVIAEIIGKPFTGSDSIAELHRIVGAEVADAASKYRDHLLNEIAELDALISRLSSPSQQEGGK